MKFSTDEKFKIALAFASAKTDTSTTTNDFLKMIQEILDACESEPVQIAPTNTVDVDSVNM